MPGHNNDNDSDIEYVGFKEGSNYVDLMDLSSSDDDEVEVVEARAGFLGFAAAAAVPHAVQTFVAPAAATRRQQHRTVPEFVSLNRNQSASSGHTFRVNESSRQQHHSPRAAKRRHRRLGAPSIPLGPSPPSPGRKRQAEDLGYISSDEDDRTTYNAWGKAQVFIDLDDSDVEVIENEPPAARHDPMHEEEYDDLERKPAAMFYPVVDKNAPAYDSSDDEMAMIAESRFLPSSTHRREEPQELLAAQSPIAPKQPSPERRPIHAVPPKQHIKPLIAQKRHILRHVPKVGRSARALADSSTAPVDPRSPVPCKPTVPLRAEQAQQLRQKLVSTLRQPPPPDDPHDEDSHQRLEAAGQQMSEVPVSKEQTPPLMLEQQETQLGTDEDDGSAWKPAASNDEYDNSQLQSGSEHNDNDSASGGTMPADDFFQSDLDELKDFREEAHVVVPPVPEQLRVPPVPKQLVPPAPQLPSAVPIDDEARSPLRNGLLENSAAQQEARRLVDSKGLSSWADSPFAPYEPPGDWNLGDVSDEEELDDEFVNLPPARLMLEHLSVRSTDPKTGHSVWEFTVVGGEGGLDHVLYDFRVFIGPSNIPGAGLGAYLTYKGARVLTSDAVAKGMKGSDVTYSESDYQMDMSQKFSTENGCIFLGRYGPLRKSDRKTDAEYSVVNWLFDNGPAEYAFAVSKKLFKRTQVIDISDPFTGTPHNTARKEFWMYVNEAGHTGKWKQNVHIKEHDGQVVRYYLHLETPLNPSDTVELLANYFKTYESIRVRHGYGIENLAGREHDDTVRPNRMSRNFEERDAVEDMVAENDDPYFTIFELSKMLEFIFFKVWTPLTWEADMWLCNRGDGESSPLSARQWKAILRAELLRRSLVLRLDTTRRAWVSSPLVEKVWSSLLSCKDLVSKMRWGRLESLLDLPEAVKDAEGLVIRDAIQEELLEAVCYGVRKRVPKLFNKAMYCAIGNRLIERICRLLFPVVLLQDSAQATAGDGAKLWRAFLEAAKEARQAIFVSVANFDQNGQLSFESGLRPHKLLSGRLTASVQQCLRVARSSDAFFLDHSTLPKGFLAALVEKIAYLDVLVVADLEPVVDYFDVPLRADDEFFMVKYSGLQREEYLTGLGALPRSKERVVATSATINTLWYTVWQVAYPVCAFASQFLPPGSFNLPELCAILEVDERTATFALNRGIKKERQVGLHRLFRERAATARLQEEPNQRTPGSKPRARGAPAATLKTQIVSKPPPDPLFPEVYRTDSLPVPKRARKNALKTA